ncbi:MAG: M1 family peptidase, partial [Firmicutes bacterium]|nr:M1 family peptidase [Bacillota bacterium]
LFFDSLRRAVGDDKFFKALRDYFDAYKYKTANPAQMAASFSKSARKDLTGYFNSWIYGNVHIIS